MDFYLGRKAIRKVPGAVIKVAPLPQPEVISGFGKRSEVGRLCEEAGLSVVLLVTDETLFGLGLHEKVTQSLRDHHIRYEVFHDIHSEPTMEIIETGRSQALQLGAQGIIVLGGGSCMDTGKIIAAGVKHPHLPIQHYLHKFALAEGGTLPMINIPTTAGTGAEATVGAVVMNEHGVKCSTVVIGLEVPYVILDSELIINAPREVTVWCAIDALSHGLEGLLADVELVEENITKSRECVRLIFENLPVLLEDPHDVEARQATLLAAHYGGNAINTQLAGYVHAFAHSLGGLYHIPHGKAIAWSLVPIISAQEYNRMEEMASLARYCHLAQETDSKEIAADKLILGLKELLSKCGLEEGCSALKQEDYDQLVQMIELDSINYSPSRTFAASEIRMLLDQIRRGF